MDFSSCFESDEDSDVEVSSFEVNVGGNSQSTCLVLNVIW